MNPDTDLVLKLQSVDTRVRKLEKEISALPKHIAQIEKTLDSHIRRLEADRAALAANQRDRKKLEGDVQVHELKISKLRDQMLLAKTNEQYRAFQNEIGYCEHEIRKAEDKILDLMAESEPLEANLKSAETALKKEKEEVESEKQAARQRTTADEKELEVLRRERAEIAAHVKPAVSALYERVRKKWQGMAVAEVQEGRCMACQIVLRPQHFQNLRIGNEVLTCESCGRILFYHPPVDVEAEMADHRAG
jgi:hypothetical protein